jgi:rubrerythrin
LESGEEMEERLSMIAKAMEAEKRAHEFYSQAAQKVTNPSGMKMLTELAEFELSHYRNLKSLFESLKGEGKWIAYGGTTFSGDMGQKKSAEPSPEAHKEEVSQEASAILQQAIRDEEKAHEYYREAAEKVTEPLGKQMFEKLAEEEKLHARILQDQLYSMTNKGVWLWGD